MFESVWDLDFITCQPRFGRLASYRELFGLVCLVSGAFAVNHSWTRSQWSKMHRVSDCYVNEDDMNGGSLKFGRAIRSVSVCGTN